MKEKMLTAACKYLTTRTEEAYMSGNREATLAWSEKLDKVIYQLLLIKNAHIIGRPIQ